MLKDAIDTTTDAARSAAARPAALAGAAVETVKAAATAIGDTVTDGWITAKIKAHFVDATLLTDGDVTVSTDGHVVTLTGTVASSAAKARAAALAGDTAGVTRVVNQLQVKSA
jgi:osmotically-inducible protein OsmY